MKTVLITFSVLALSFLPNISFGQTAIIPSGGEASGTAGTMSYTLSQVFYSSNISNNGFENQGVQQPFELFTVGLEEAIDVVPELMIYPNPTSENITLIINRDKNLKWAYQLFNQNGILLKNEESLDENRIISLTDLPAGVYILQVLNSKSIIKSFKIIKN